MKKLITIIALTTVPFLSKAQLDESQVRIVQPTCFGSNDGSIQIVLNDSENYSFEWSNGAKGSSIDKLYGGSYICTVTDPEGNVFVENFTLVRPRALSVGVSTFHYKGESNLGACVTHVDGGTGEYTYKWSNNATSAGIDELRPGSYTILVSDDNNCSLDLTIEIKDKSEDARLSTTSASVN